MDHRRTEYKVDQHGLDASKSSLLCLTALLECRPTRTQSSHVRRLGNLLQIVMLKRSRYAKPRPLVPEEVLAYGQGSFRVMEEHPVSPLYLLVVTSLLLSTH